VPLFFDSPSGVNPAKNAVGFFVWVRIRKDATYCPKGANTRPTFSRTIRCLCFLPIPLDFPRGMLYIVTDNGDSFWDRAEVHYLSVRPPLSLFYVPIRRPVPVFTLPHTIASTRSSRLKFCRRADEKTVPFARREKVKRIFQFF